MFIIAFVGVILLAGLLATGDLPQAISKSLSTIVTRLPNRMHAYSYSSAAEKSGIEEELRRQDEQKESQENARTYSIVFSAFMKTWSGKLLAFYGVFACVALLAAISQKK